MGYQTQEVKAAKTMRITLKEDTEMLDEVVVVGYGVQKKANLTGAVSTVDLNKTMAGRPQQDVAKALQGAVPGLHSHHKWCHRRDSLHAYTWFGDIE